MKKIDLLKKASTIFKVLTVACACGTIVATLIDNKQKDETHEKTDSNESTNVEVEELTEEQKEIYNETVARIKKEMKPIIMRKRLYNTVKLSAILMFSVGMSGLFVSQDMERRDKMMNKLDYMIRECVPA